MEIRYGARFQRDLERARNADLYRRVEMLIEQIKSAPTISDVRNVRKIQGWENLYRIRIGDYRLGLEVEDDIVSLLVLGHRRDFYRSFP